MYHPAPLTSKTITSEIDNFNCLHMVGLGFNNTGETTATIGGRTVPAGSSYTVNGDIPLSTESLSITFEGEGKNKLEYTAQIIPAKLICHE